MATPNAKTKHKKNPKRGKPAQPRARAMTDPDTELVHIGDLASLGWRSQLNQTHDRGGKVMAKGSKTSQTSRNPAVPAMVPIKSKALKSFQVEFRPDNQIGVPMGPRGRYTSAL
jgi:hypothetical protein